jgi:DNA replication protein DnaC
METTMPETKVHDVDELRRRANQLRLYGLLSDWGRLCTQPWVAELIELEEQERARRSLEYRINNAKLGAFKPIVDFDWKHPTKIDKALVEDLFDLDFISEPANVVFVGPNGVGKTLLAQNLAYRAIVRGHAVRFTSASDMLNDLSGRDGSALKLRLKQYVSPKLLVIDELGYLGYDNRGADLLYQVISRRYESRAAIVLTTNKPFAEWNSVFDSAACLVTLIDRLCHRCEIVSIEGDSYRVKEAKQRAVSKRAQRSERKGRGKSD